MSQASDLKARRRIVEAFIAANPSVIVLTPQTRVIDDEGYTEEAGAPRVEQVGRMIPQGGTGGTRVVETDQGSLRTVEYQLLLPWGAAVEKSDRFTFLGDECEVIDTEPDNGYEVRAQVIRRLARPDTVVEP